MSGDSASVSVYVAVAPPDAFEVFTREIDLWWRQGPAYRIAGRRRGQIHFEEGAGGRLFESFDERTFEVGRITTWEPPARLAFEWRGVNFKPDEKTLVEVSFAPQREGRWSPCATAASPRCGPITRCATAARAPTSRASSGCGGPA